MTDRTYNGVVTDWMLDCADTPPENDDDYLALDDEPPTVESTRAESKRVDAKLGDDGCLLVATGILIGVGLPLGTLTLLLWPGGVW